MICDIKQKKCFMNFTHLSNNLKDKLLMNIFDTCENSLRSPSRDIAETPNPIWVSSFDYTLDIDTFFYSFNSEPNLQQLIKMLSDKLKEWEVTRSKGIQIASCFQVTCKRRTGHEFGGNERRIKFYNKTLSLYS